MSTVTEAVEVKVGDFFYSSWGYDQTNIDFYKVVGTTKSGKSVKVQPWTSRVVGERGGPSERVVPGERPRMVRVRDENYAYTGETVEAPVETKRLRRGGYKNFSFYVNSYSNAYYWEGESLHQTGSGWGH